MTKYDFLWATRVILSNVRTNSNLTYFHFWLTFHVNRGRYDFLWARRVILSYVRTDLNLTQVHLWSTF